MKKEFINPKLPRFIHGADYNPEQWIRTPEIWDEDMRLMKKAGCNAMSIGIFSWSTLEPEEGKYDFSFLDTIMDKLADNGMYAVLATPSASRPQWLAEKYPEVLRTNHDRSKNLYGFRHNHCFTSPVYREKVTQINTLLAERYKDHPALLMWHVSNEFCGACHCDMCQNAFREWLKKRYNNDLDLLNYKWWNTFWGHTYTSWDQIQSPTVNGESLSNGLKLSWARFVSDQTADYIHCETRPLREITPNVPITTNFMGNPYQGLNYNVLKKEIDVISWDSYPWWHAPDGNAVIAEKAAFVHDLYRCLKMKPFMLMESTPSVINYMRHNKLKRPGMHKLSSLQAVAHGSDTVQYFQWRKSRGAYEKLHGAVVDHYGRDNTRIFGEVSEVGRSLSDICEVVGSHTDAKAAIYYDWENDWGLSFVQNNEPSDKKYLDTVLRHYSYFHKRGINVDVVNGGEEYDYSRYDLVIAPMVYMMPDSLRNKLEAYVNGGGCLVSGYMTGWVDEDDLCHLGGFPAGNLKEVFGLWAEEIDELYDTDKNHIEMLDNAPFSGTFKAIDMCEIVHPSTAEALAVYKEDFYASGGALFKNSYGSGDAYYIACRTEDSFLDALYDMLTSQRGIDSVIAAPLPEGVTAHSRTDGENTYIFVQNYNSDAVTLENTEGFTDLESGEAVSGTISLEGYGIRVLKK